jgi:hypothetical protein
MRLRTPTPSGRRAIGPLVAAVFIVFAVIYVVPFLVYALTASSGGIAMPEGSPALFLFSIAVSKFGTALAFVLIFDLAQDRLSYRWLNYGALWALMFVIGEAGQAIGPGYTWAEAAAGALSELIYFPLAAFFVSRLLPPHRS